MSVTRGIFPSKTLVSSVYNDKQSFGQPALQFYSPEAILNWPKAQSMVKQALENFNHACPSGKSPKKSACLTGKSYTVAPDLLDTVFLKP